MGSKIKDFIRSSLCVLFVTALIIGPSMCNIETDESPYLKYSEEANQKISSQQRLVVNEGNGHNNDHHHHHIHSSSEKTSQTKKHDSDTSNIWFHAIGSTVLISIAPFVLLYVIPLDDSEAMRPRLKVILAFASGGLLGDAFLHLIPHSTHPHSHSHDHDHDHDHNHKHNGHDMSIGLWILGGIVAFLCIEKLVRFLKVSHSHSHVISASKKRPQSKGAEKLKNSESWKDVEISGYLNLAADFVHNFTDGLAIGASYLAGDSIGLITTLTILLHEVPHEIGDLAILIKSGCSKRRAMCLQLLTAVGAITGTMIALLGASDEHQTPYWILPFTAGGFIYIATVSVLPELLEDSTKLKQSMKEITALLSGVGLMVFIANFE